MDAQMGSLDREVLYTVSPSSLAPADSKRRNRLLSLAAIICSGTVLLVSTRALQGAGIY